MSSSKLTFEPFRKWWKINGDKKSDFLEDTKFSPQTAAKVWYDRFPVRSDVIETICVVYNLKIQDVIEIKNDSE